MITRLHCMRVKSLTGRYAPFTITGRPIIGCQSQGAMAPIYSPSHVRDDTVCLQILIIRRAIPAINYAAS